MAGGPAVPALAEINVGFEVEWQAGYDIGYAGQPFDAWEHGELFHRYGDSPQGRLQHAAFSRGHIRGTIARSTESSRRHRPEQQQRREARDAAFAYGIERGYIQPVSA